MKSVSDMSHLRYRKFWLFIGWAWLVSIWYLSLTAEPPSLDFGVTFSDKIQHAMAYGALMAWFLQLYHRRHSRIVWAIAFIGMGILLEYLQRMTAYRDFEYLDMVADTVGVLLAIAIVRGKLSRVLWQLEQSRIILRLEQYLARHA